MTSRHKPRRPFAKFTIIVDDTARQIPIAGQTGLDRKLSSLETLAEACGFAPENEYTTLTVRQLLHGPFRILYEVHDANVYVLTVRHGARRFMSGDELEQME